MDSCNFCATNRNYLSVSGILSFLYQKPLKEKKREVADSCGSRPNDVWSSEVHNRMHRIINIPNSLFLSVCFIKKATKGQLRWLHQGYMVVLLPKQAKEKQEEGSSISKCEGVNENMFYM